MEAMQMEFTIEAKMRMQFTNGDTVRIQIAQV